MARKRIIVGLGETLLVEYPERTAAAGIASGVAIQAALLGHDGVAVSRVGQDEQADELLGLLADAQVKTTHVQSDPDLPTGRVTIRAIGGSYARYLESRAAFDNLQSDFDLEDVAQQADAVIFGILTRRSGQTRSEENRFLGACGAAIKVFDLTNRGDAENGATDMDRRNAASGLEFADIVVLDRFAIDVVRPQSSSMELLEAAREFRRESGASCVLAVERSEDSSTGNSAGTERAAVAANTANTADTANTANTAETALLHGISNERETTVRIPTSRAALEATLVAFTIGLLSGKDVEAALAVGARVGEFANSRPGEKVPEDWFA